MPLFASSTPISRYLVQTAASNDATRAKVLDGLRANAMPEILGENDTMIIGWVPFETPYKPDFDTQSFTYGTDMVFSFRVDQKKVPAKIIQRELQMAIEKKKQEQGRDFLSKNEKSELKEQVIDIVTAKTPFTTDLHHVSWNTGTNELLLFTATKAVKESFETLFFKSFELKLIPLFPFTLANFKLGSLSDKQKDKLATLTPSGVR